MKASSTKYSPARVTLTFESQEELDRFGSLFNTSVICDAIGRAEHGSATDTIRQAFKQAGSNVSKYPSAITAIAAEYFRRNR